MIEQQPDGIYARFQTNQGEFLVRLFTEEAPVTTGNFIGLAMGTKPYTDPATKKETTGHFYDGIVFHRIIDGFMIQGGDPLGQGYGGPGYKFVDEFHPKLRHGKPGMLSMANSGPNTNGSQFFITLAPTPHLDNRHAIFGEVVEGLDVVQKIGKVRTGAQDRPVSPVVMEQVRVFQVQGGQATPYAGSSAA